MGTAKEMWLSTPERVLGTVASHRTGKRRGSPSACYPRPSLSSPVYEEVWVGVRLGDVGPGDPFTLHEKKTVVAPGSSSSSGSRLPGTTVPADCSPGLGELVILVGWVPRWE
jgi:hypothetical protein